MWRLSARSVTSWTWRMARKRTAGSRFYVQHGQFFRRSVSASSASAPLTNQSDRERCARLDVRRILRCADVRRSDVYARAQRRSSARPNATDFRPLNKPCSAARFQHRRSRAKPARRKPRVRRGASRQHRNHGAEVNSSIRPLSGRMAFSIHILRGIPAPIARTLPSSGGRLR